MTAPDLPSRELGTADFDLEQAVKDANAEYFAQARANAKWDYEALSVPAFLLRDKT